MLAYLSSGTRHYGESPIRVFARQYWEFEAVLEGRIAPVFSGGIEDIGLSSDCLWVFPPQFGHGWTGDEEESSIVVCHFDRIPEMAAVQIRRQGYVRVILDQRAKDNLLEIVHELARIRKNPDALSLLRFEKVCAELCIVALERIPKGVLPAFPDRAGYVADSACAWYSEHMHERPTIPVTARVFNCSSSHFRRLFLKARSCPPEAVFLEMRLHRAQEYLRRGGASIKEIADACGYDSQSSFSRAFKQRLGIAPSRFIATGGYTNLCTPGLFL